VRSCSRGTEHHCGVDRDGVRQKSLHPCEPFLKVVQLSIRLTFKKKGRLYPLRSSTFCTEDLGSDLVEETEAGCHKEQCEDTKRLTAQENRIYWIVIIAYVSLAISVQSKHSFGNERLCFFDVTSKKISETKYKIIHHVVHLSC